MELISEITCPKCKYSVSETMPEDSCQYFWECPSCGEVSKPKPGDCCVYCSYGTVVCPSKQIGNK
ncbi:MAG: GDCCVxC domain-containing (seleno)protein [Gracilimonas sp.]